MVHLAGFTRFDNNANAGAQSLADQVVVYGGSGKQSGDRHSILADQPVRQDDDVEAFLDGALGPFAERVERRLHAFGATVGGEGRVQRLGLEVIVGDVANGADLFQVLVAQDRLAHFKAAQLALIVQVEDVRTRADEGDEAHHQLFADRVDRRVRHLGEVLLEIAVKQLWLVGEDRDGRVGTHGPNGFLAGGSHGGHQGLHVFLGVAESLLALEKRHIRLGRSAAHIRQFLDIDLGLVQPLLIGLKGGKLFLDLFVGDDAAFLEVDQQHLARLQTPFLHDAVFRVGKNAHLGGEDYVIVVGDEVAGRAQAVTVQRSADLATIGEGHGGGAVPRLHQGCVVLVKSAALGIHQLMAVPGFRDHHHHGVGKRIATEHQKFERVIKAGRVRLALDGERPDLLEVIPEDLGFHRALARGHPVDVAAHRVDLAIVADHAEGLGQGPGGEGVRREALMHERQRGHHPLVLEVEIVLADLIGEQHALVVEDAGRQRGDVGVSRSRDVFLIKAVPDFLADHEKLALEGVLIGAVVAPGHEELLVDRLRRQHRVAEI